jgi:hypothetical protein
MMMKTLDSKIFKSMNPVGVKIPTIGIKLPQNDFAYGKKEPSDKEGCSTSNDTFNKSNKKLAVSFKNQADDSFK